MEAFLNAILAKLSSILGWFGNLFKAVFAALWDIEKDFLAWCLENFMTLASSAVNSLDLSGVTASLQSAGTLPGNVLEVLSAAGMGTAFQIITAAILIRFLLQLIPLVRLGS
jgi:hypothetical protein